MAIRRWRITIVRASEDPGNPPEMLNPQVILDGNMALLTWLVNYIEDTGLEPVGVAGIQRLCISALAALEDDPLALVVHPTSCVSEHDAGDVRVEA
jgi:hypothetical protein